MDTLAGGSVLGSGCGHAKTESTTDTERADIDESPKLGTEHVDTDEGVGDSVDDDFRLSISRLILSANRR